MLRTATARTASRLLAQARRLRSGSFALSIAVCSVTSAPATPPHPEPVQIEVRSGEIGRLHSSWHLRVVNRRFVSHLVHEMRARTPVVTIILTHGPNYWAFHARSYALHAPCRAPRLAGGREPARAGELKGATRPAQSKSRSRRTGLSCSALIARLDRHLRDGHNLGLRVEGSWVRTVILFGGTAAANRGGGNLKPITEPARPNAQ